MVHDQNCKLISIAGTCSSDLHEWNINLWGYNFPWKGGEGSRECFLKFQDDTRVVPRVGYKLVGESNRRKITDFVHCWSKLCFCKQIELCENAGIWENTEIWLLQRKNRRKTSLKLEAKQNKWWSRSHCSTNTEKWKYFLGSRSDISNRFHSSLKMLY